MTHTYELIKIIGSPFIEQTPDISFDILEAIYDRAFADRVALLYLTIHRKEGWPEVLEEKYQTHQDYELYKTLLIVKAKCLRYNILFQMSL